MSSMTVMREQFPHAFAEDAKTGDVVAFVVRGRIRRLEDDLVDVTPLDGPPEYLPGRHETEVVITEIEAVGWADVADLPPGLHYA